MRCSGALKTSRLLASSAHACRWCLIRKQREAGALACSPPDVPIPVFPGSGFRKRSTPMQRASAGAADGAVAIGLGRDLRPFCLFA